MDCEILPICGFFQKYNTPDNTSYERFITRYCKGPDKNKCKRLEYRNAYGQPPADEMLPSGLMLKI